MATTSKSKRAKEAAEAATDLKAKAAAGDQDALEAVEEIVRNFNAWQQAQDEKKRVSKACKEREDQEFAALKNAVEDSLPAPCGPREVEAKLTTVESAWQDYEEAKSQGIEERKEAKEALKKAQEKLDRSVKDSSQLVLKISNGERLG